MRTRSPPFQAFRLARRFPAFDRGPVDRFHGFQRWMALACRARLTENISPYLDYMGAVQGVIHALFKESDPPHFKLRDSVTGNLVDCFYKPEHYANILRTLPRKDDRVHVSGLVRASRIDKKIESLRVVRIESPVEFTDADFEAFFGCAPDMTGEIGSADFIERNRHDA